MWNIISQGPWSEVPSWHAHSEKTLSEYVRYNSYENSSRLTRDALGTSDYKPYVAKLTSTFLDSHFIFMVILWNSLPLGFKKCTSLSCFKTNLRAHYKSLVWPASDPGKTRTLVLYISRWNVDHLAQK